MPSHAVIRFGRYRLDPGQGLTRGRREIRITPKSLAVLRLLAERSGQVVTKAELFETVWSDAAVSDAALTSCIQELRHALDDDARRPRVIETVHRRGFRFLVPAHLESIERDRATAADPVPLVGRAAALDALMTALDRARSGIRRVVFVTGEAGIGKTALVDAFCRSLGATGHLRVARADCVERYSAGEAYQPLLEALTRLCRLPNGEGALAALRRYAPTWLAQLPALHSPSESRALERRTAGVTRERMLRELNDCLDAAALETTLVLWIDDLQWSDASTLDWLASFAQRPERARVLVIATSRRGASPTVDDLCSQLQLRGPGVEIALAGLDEDATRELVARRCRGLDETSARGLAQQMHAQTEGHPLFISMLLDDLQARGASAGPHRAGAAERVAAEGGVPDTLRRFIGRQFDRLDPGEQRLLEAASVLGGEWSCATVAACTRGELPDVEASLLALAGRHVFVRHAGSGEWPDGTVAERFAFIHALHCEVLHDRLPARRRAELHRLVGDRLEAAFGPRATDLSAQLAVHFEEARDVAKAISYLARAGETASRRGAADEARRHLLRAVGLLADTPPSAARDEHEVDLQILLGGVIMAAEGWGAAGAERAFDRARDLCARLDATPRLFPSLWGLWLFRWGRGDLRAARDVTVSLEDLARESTDRHRRLQACHAMWATAFSMGELDAARAHADEGFALYDPARDADRDLLYGNHDAGVCSRIFAARALAIQGRFSESVRASDDAIAHARRLDHPFTLALALVFGAAVQQLRRDAPATTRHAGEAVALSARHGFRLMHAWGSALEGWAAVDAGSTESAVTVIPGAVKAATATGSGQFRTFLLVLAAEAHLKSGRPELGLAAIEQARAAVDETGERFCEAEIHRLRGELLLASPDRPTVDAERSLHVALETARRQQAHLFALRASIGLARLWQRLGRSADARALVSLACRQLPDDAETPDIADARVILAG
jgi:DNA-binding winged helix-turn-helix (wHTH) protein/predicted ATPase